MAARQPGFLAFKQPSDPDDLTGGRRKRVNKNKKKNWNKHSDIQDVEEFLDDVRLQQRATGGLISEQSDESLFFLDIGEAKKPVQEEPVKGKKSKPLRIDLILQNNSLVSAPKDVLAYQQPNAKKLRRTAERLEKQAAIGQLPRKQTRLLNLRATTAATSSTRKQPLANNHPDRPYYDLWGAEAPQTADSYFLEQTGKKLVKRPDKLNEKPSLLPAVEVIAPGGSYNPDFFSHQALLSEAHEVEVKKLKAEQRLERQLAVNRDALATEETVFKEQVEGLHDEEEEEDPNEEDDDMPVGAVPQEKKTEKQRKRERTEKVKEQQRQSLRTVTQRHQQLFQLRSIQASLKLREQRTRELQKKRKAKMEAQKSLPRRLGRLKYQAPDLEIQLSDEIPGSLRKLKPEGSILKDRFKSMQKRNLIEPRERAKFKRRLKVKYTEKRAFKEIT